MKRPIKIWYFYRYYQQIFDELSKKLGKQIMFVKDFDSDTFDRLGISRRNEHSEPAVVIFDDTGDILFGNKKYQQMFNSDIHHLKLCSIV